MSFIVSTLAFEFGILDAFKSRLKKIHKGLVIAGMARAARELEMRGYHDYARSLRQQIRTGEIWS